MDKFKVISDFNTLSSSKFDVVHGEFYVKCGDYCFPEVGWSDSVVVLLVGWLEKIQLLFDDETKTIELWFMEGPFFIELSCIHEVVRVDFFEDKEELFMEHSCSVNRDEIIKNLLGLAKQLLINCDEHNWKNSDLHNLSLIIDKLCKKYPLTHLH